MAAPHECGGPLLVAAQAPPPNAVVWPRPERVHVGFTWTPGLRNVRVPVQEPVQESPEPLRYGATPARRSQVQVATFRYEMGQEFGSEDFIMEDLIFRSSRQTLPGQMQPWTERANTAPPQHVAYGSLFQYDPTIYGWG